jgi:hypothetical protein
VVGDLDRRVSPIRIIFYFKLKPWIVNPATQEILKQFHTLVLVISDLCKLIIFKSYKCLVISKTFIFWVRIEFWCIRYKMVISFIDVFVGAKHVLGFIF